MQLNQLTKKLANLTFALRPLALTLTPAFALAQLAIDVGKPLADFVHGTFRLVADRLRFLAVAVTKFTHSMLKGLGLFHQAVSFGHQRMDIAFTRPVTFASHIAFASLLVSITLALAQLAIEMGKPLANLLHHTVKLSGFFVLSVTQAVQFAIDLTDSFTQLVSLTMQHMDFVLVPGFGPFSMFAITMLGLVSLTAPAMLGVIVVVTVIIVAITVTFDKRTVDHLDFNRPVSVFVAVAMPVLSGGFVVLMIVVVSLLMIAMFAVIVVAITVTFDKRTVDLLDFDRRVSLSILSGGFIAAAGQGDEAGR